MEWRRRMVAGLAADQEQVLNESPTSWGQVQVPAADDGVTGGGPDGWPRVQQVSGSTSIGGSAAAPGHAGDAVAGMDESGSGLRSGDSLVVPPLPTELLPPQPLEDVVVTRLAVESPAVVMAAATGGRWEEQQQCSPASPPGEVLQPWHWQMVQPPLGPVHQQQPPLPQQGWHPLLPPAHPPPPSCPMLLIMNPQESFPQLRQPYRDQPPPPPRQHPFTNQKCEFVQLQQQRFQQQQPYPQEAPGPGQTVEQQLLHPQPQLQHLQLQAQWLFRW